MQKSEPVCIDCDHAFELPEDETVVACSAHLEYRAASHPATCSDYLPRRPVAESNISVVWHEE